MKPQLAPKVAPMAGGTGLTPAACARAIMTGMTILADAVFEDVSLTRMAMNIAPKVMPQTEVAPLIFSRFVPITSASFVSNISEPSAMPPPKSSSVPQSIFVASYNFV